MGASYWLTMFAQEVPLFLVLVMGAILAIVFMGRAPLAATLVLIGAGVLMLTQIVGLSGFAALNRMEDGGGALRLVFIIGLELVRALAIGAFIGAAFAGRIEQPANSPPPHQFRP